jgi:hypothetical protein
VTYFLFRFPEELGGEGCFGSTILRVVAGSGYKLNWASQNGFVKSEESAVNLFDNDNVTVGVPGGSSSTERGNESESCGCVHVKDRSVMKKFIETLNRSVPAALHIPCCESIHMIYHEDVLYFTFYYSVLEHVTLIVTSDPSLSNTPMIL